MKKERELSSSPAAIAKRKYLASLSPERLKELRRRAYKARRLKQALSHARWKRDHARQRKANQRHRARYTKAQRDRDNAARRRKSEIERSRRQDTARRDGGRYHGWTMLAASSLHNPSYLVVNPDGTTRREDLRESPAETLTLEKAWEEFLRSSPLRLVVL